jgi:hypothetical protein
MATRWKKLVAILLTISALGIVCAGVLYFWAKHEFATVAISEADVATFVERAAVRPDFAGEGREPCSDSHPQRNAYFGALHVHTALSGDAAGWGVTTTPEESYRFARGQDLEVRFRDDDPGKAVPVVRLDRPLDFAAVTDHANQMAEARICLTPELAGYDSVLCRVFRGDIEPPFEDPVLRSIFRMLPMTLLSIRSQRLCGEDGVACLRETEPVWNEVQRAAEGAYDRSTNCRFTSFVGYEYTLQQQGSNLHRNVIFANAAVPPSPLSAREATRPELLWSWLKRQCQDVGVGCDAITIPHNSNWSSGRMFFPYTLSDYSEEEQRRLALLRNEMEPLAEILQVKGDSECRNGLGRVFGQADEYCDFEKVRLPKEPIEDCLDSVGSRGMQQQGCMSRWSFVRYGLIEGLREEKQLGTNSFKLGIVAATDNHNGAPGAVSESDWIGSIGVDLEPRERLREAIEIPNLAKADATRFNPGGISGVWAEENTRESLFAAMRRRETFGTSGPRIIPRFFASWNFDPAICSSPDLLTEAYAAGVPMGGDLPAPGVAEPAPTFLVTAMMDSAEGAAPLQKIQIIKGWTDDEGNMHQKVLDVAGDATTTAAVDPVSCERSGRGHASLCSVWRDDEFDSAQSAVYYSRVIETPSCRWTSHDCNRFAESERPPICDSPSLQTTIQERAWTSPIWYSAE